MPLFAGVPYRDPDALFAFQQQSMSVAIHNDLSYLGSIMVAVQLGRLRPQSQGDPVDLMRTAISAHLRRLDITFVSFLDIDRAFFELALIEIRRLIDLHPGRYARRPTTDLVQRLYDLYLAQLGQRLAVALETARPLVRAVVDNAAKRVVAVSDEVRFPDSEADWVAGQCDSMLDLWKVSHDAKAENIRLYRHEVAGVLARLPASPDPDRVLALPEAQYRLALEEPDRDLLNATDNLARHIQNADLDRAFDQALSRSVLRRMHKAVQPLEISSSGFGRLKRELAALLDKAADLLVGQSDGNFIRYGYSRAQIARNPAAKDLKRLLELSPYPQSKLLLKRLSAEPSRTLTLILAFFAESQRLGDPDAMPAYSLRHCRAVKFRAVVTATFLGSLSLVLDRCRVALDRFYDRFLSECHSLPDSWRSDLLCDPPAWWYRLYERILKENFNFVVVDVGSHGPRGVY